MQHNDRVPWKAGILVDNEVRIGLTRVFPLDHCRRAESSDVLDSWSDFCTICMHNSVLYRDTCPIVLSAENDMYTESAVKLMSRLSSSNRMVPTGSTTTIFQKKNHISVRDCV